ncbi:hypothetical protein QBC32DRAFT_188507, partial [Pseudoneurospora amorphoporcata]
IKAAAAMAPSFRIPQLRSHDFLHLPRKSDEFTMTDPTISEPKPIPLLPHQADRTNRTRTRGSKDRAKPLASVANHNKEQEQPNR